MVIIVKQPCGCYILSDKDDENPTDILSSPVCDVNRAEQSSILVEIANW